MVEAYDLFRESCGEDFEFAWTKFKLEVLDHNNYYKKKPKRFLEHVLALARFEYELLKKKEEIEEAERPP